MSYEKFAADSMLTEACVFNLSQIGELANQLDDDFTLAHAEIPWRSLYGLRNRIVHDYDGVNMNLIWTIITEDLEPLRRELQKIFLRFGIRLVFDNEERGDLYEYTKTY